MALKALNYILKIPIYLILLVILYLNISLYGTQDYNKSKGYDEDVYAQLQHLKHEMHDNNAGVNMQSIFPEGFVFQNALYGLTWCDLVNDKTDPKIKEEAIKEIDWALDEIHSTTGKAIFDPNLPLRYGVFYRGWENYLLAKRLTIGSSTSTQKKLFIDNCREITSAYDSSSTPYLESYRNASWPADNLLAVASIALRDKITYESHPPKSPIKRWVEMTKQHLDENGLIPHSTNAQTGKTNQKAKGNSQSLILCLLKDIDSSFANEQFAIYKKLYLDSRLGLPGIRENMMGEGGGGDIDSGPVIWDIGGAASIVGQKTMATFGEWDTYHGLRNSIEAFGCAYTWSGKKKYVFGAMPMADAFIAWSNASAHEYEVQSGNWRWKFQLISLGLSFILILLIRRLK